MTQLWWDEFPERLEFELEQLDTSGIKYIIDESEKKAGKIVLNLEYEIENEPIKLVARFPDVYPYFRFELFAPNLNLEKHQHPYGKNLCLIGRSSGNWNSSEDTLARFITEQLPKVIKSARGEGGVAEEQQGEPISDYYPYYGSMIMIDSVWKIDPSLKEGALLIGMDRTFNLKRMAILEVQDRTGKVVAQAGEHIRKLYSPYNFRAHWVRVENPIKNPDPNGFFQGVLNHYPYLSKRSWNPLKGKHMDFNVVGVVFPEELRYQQKGDGWVFVFTCRERVGEGKKKRWKNNYMFVRAGRSGVQDTIERVPSLTFLREKTVCVVGLGSIGAPSVIEFARCGVKELRILDYDYVDPATIMRWPFGHAYVGMQKTSALNDFISQNYPHTTVKVYNARIGALDGGQMSLLLEFIEGADLVYDATAEFGVHHLLSDFTKDKKIPYIIASATPGAWGGLVAKFVPEGICWQCFESARTEDKIPLPPEAFDDFIQPAGCADPTFTGTSFDLHEVVLSGVRLAISELSSETDKDSYGKIDWNIAYLSLRKEGNPIFPEWSHIKLDPYPDCPCLQKKKK